MRLFEPDLLTLCWECGDALGGEDIVPASCAGYWSHTPCDLEAACEADAPLERPTRSVTGGPMEGPYSARFPSSSVGRDIPASARPPVTGPAAASRHVTAAAAVERPPPG